MKKTQFDKEHLESVKNSYFNILALFLGQQQIESRFLRCLLKWGFQLNLSPEDLTRANVDLSNLQFAHPGDHHVVWLAAGDSPSSAPAA